ncbi:tetratricopeptide repeat protein [Streptomyces brevispora]|uniref:tetratricopeptide repeat protein n=1 Tax=Streptomyces brevispora TaxID=887462 RepID=UPI0033F84FDD
MPQPQYGSLKEANLHSEGGAPGQEPVVLGGAEGSVTAGGAIIGSAIGPNARVSVVLPAPGPVEWPVTVGSIPGQASAFQPRSALREQVNAGWAGGGTVVLSGGGGVGKSQFAASYAHQAADEEVELRVWVHAAAADQAVAAYARAALRVHASGADGQDAEADARGFLEWLATTTRTWLVILDNITDPAELSPWWPPVRGNGRVLATTRLREAALSGGGRTVVAVDTYTPAEAHNYLATRLTSEGMAHLLDHHTERLLETLGRLPLALSHAGAYIINEAVSCTEYLQDFTNRRRRLDELLPADADTEGYGRQVAASLLLSLDAAQAREPVGLAAPALRLAAHLDPAGHPRALWATEAVTAYLADHRTVRTGTEDGQPARDEVRAVDSRQTRSALRLLHRYNLLTDDTTDSPRAVRIHALTALATQEALPTDAAPAIAEAAASALLALWPEADHTAPGLAAALRANTDTLATCTDDLITKPGGQALLFRAGNSLLHAGLNAAGLSHWQAVALDSERVLEPEHPATLAARANLTAAYSQAGLFHEAIRIGEQVVADCERILDPDHLNTLHARVNLANSYQYADRTNEAITLLEQVAADSERILPPDHPDTLAVRASLATSYRHADRLPEAIHIQEQVLADSERTLPPDHPDTLAARASLATSYQHADRNNEAITLLEQVAADSERILSPDHPDTLAVRAHLATSYRHADRLPEAIHIQEQVLADSERILGPEHLSTLYKRAGLAASYQYADRNNDAIPLLEQVAADSERTFGPHHPNTHAADRQLADCLLKAGRAQLPSDPQGAWKYARRVVKWARPRVKKYPEVCANPLRAAYLLAADAFDADGRPAAAADYRHRAAGQA